MKQKDAPQHANFDFSHMKGDKLQMHFYWSLNWHLYKVEIGA
jgi:hypothetical protein